MNTDAKSFNNNADLYNEARPGYSDEVYTLISKYKSFSEISQILEIGSGNGIATREIWNSWESYITALEPGKELCNLLAALFPNNEKVSIRNNTFEEFISNTIYDGIFSATAFHWLNAKTKYQNCYKLLKQDGILVLYWNNYGIADEKLSNKIQMIYNNYGFINSERSHAEIIREKSNNRTSEIEQSGLFVLVENKLIPRQIDYSIERYIMLLKTFPDHSKDKIPKIESMYNEIRRLAKGYNCIIPVSVVVDLKIAKKANN